MCQPGRPGPPGRRPGRGLGLGLLLPALPEREVARVALAARVGVGRGLHVVDLLVGQLAVRRPRPHVEVDVARAVLGRVGVAAGDQRGDQLDHLGDVAGGAGLVGRRQHVDRRQRLVELAVHVVGEVEPGPALLVGLGQDLVVDVGDVADERDVVPAVGQPAPQHVEVDRRPDVPDVRLRLDGETADVDARLPLLEGNEVTDLAGRGVVQPECHPAKSRVGGRVPARIAGCCDSCDRSDHPGYPRLVPSPAPSLLATSLVATALLVPSTPRAAAPAPPDRLRPSGTAQPPSRTGSLRGAEVRRGRVVIAAKAARHPDRTPARRYETGRWTSPWRSAGFGLHRAGPVVGRADAAAGAWSRSRCAAAPTAGRRAELGRRRAVGVRRQARAPHLRRRPGRRPRPTSTSTPGRWARPRAWRRGRCG